MAVSTLQGAKQLLGKLEVQSKIFASCLLGSDPHVRYLAKLPFPRKVVSAGGLDAQGTFDLEVADDRYTVLSHIENDNKEAGAVATILSKLDYELDQDRKATLRMPGLILVDDDVVQSARAFNKAKSEFKEAVSSLPGDTSRGAVKAALECCLLQAYRKILVLDEPIEAISYTWAAVNHSVKRLTVKKLREQINAYYIGGNSEALSETDELGDIGERMLGLISDLPETEIVAFKRPVKPHIKVNYKLSKRGWKSADGSLPVLLSKSAAVSLEVLTQLSEAVRKRAPRASVYCREPIIERLHCYRYAKAENV